MCGIIGGLSERNIVPIILEGLSRLEYRGYDSVGIAVIDEQKLLSRKRVTGRVNQLKTESLRDNFGGKIGIGHTRWATHGGVSVDNAHPHFSDNTLAIVHNGIIENYAELRTELIKDGYRFDSQTDTEVIVHLIHSFYIKNNDLFQSVNLATARLKGAYAIGVISNKELNKIVCARNGSPLVLGLGINEMFFASDISALLPVTQNMVYLEDGDIAVLSLDDYVVYDKNQKIVARQSNISQLSLSQTELGSYRHYMQKEIFEQINAIVETLEKFNGKFEESVFGDEAGDIFRQINRVQIVACGTSFNAAIIAKYWIEEFAGIECNVEIASEYRYRRVYVDKNVLLVSVSQSGETADTIASIKYAQSLGMDYTLAICNVAESSLIRLSRLSFLTQAGPEIGVASTKAFTTQLIALLFLAKTLAKVRNALSEEVEQQDITNIRALPNLIKSILHLEPQIIQIAKQLEDKEHALFLGRHSLYPIALEGALKLKEISYIQAEGYASGELKHGPLALVDKNMPVIALMPKNLLCDKVKSNIEEVLARQGLVYLFTDDDDSDKLSDRCINVVNMPTSKVATYLLPILYVIPLQLLAYHTAIIKGTDVDKPRNLAKSVTVE